MLWQGGVGWFLRWAVLVALRHYLPLQHISGQPAATGCMLLAAVSGEQELERRQSLPGAPQAKVAAKVRLPLIMFLTLMVSWCGGKGRWGMGDWDWHALWSNM